jgi:LysM repeat protein
MRRVALLAAVFVASFVMFAAKSEASAQAPKATKKPSKIVKVRSGDSLSIIAKRQKTHYKRIFYANPKIKDPDLIFAGDNLRIPHKQEKLKARPLAATAAPAQTYHAAQPSYQTARYNYQPAPAAVPANAVSGSVWDRLAQCESGGNWAINTGNGFYGGLQFTLATWRGVGGSGYPHQASRAEQIKRGQILQARSGWGQWPACTAKMGLR